MKKLILVLAIAGSFTTPIANADDVFCERVSELAEAIMKNRQIGVSMRRSMEIADTKLMKLMVEEAYEHPRYSTESVQQSTIDDFTDRWYMSCYKYEKRK